MTVYSPYTIKNPEKSWYKMKYIYIKISDPYSLEMKKILFCFYFIKTKNVIKGISSWILYGNVDKIEIKNQWYNYNFSKLKESIEYEFQGKYENSDIFLNYENLPEPKKFNAKGFIILECLGNELVIPTKFNENFYADLSISLEYKDREKFYKTIEEIESKILTLTEEDLFLFFEEKNIISKP